APNVAVATLQTNLNRLAATPTVTDQLLAPVAQWRVPSGTINIKQDGADRLLQLVQGGMPEKPAEQVARSEALAGVLVGIAKSNLGDISTRATAAATTLGGGLGPVLKPAPLVPVGNGPTAPLQPVAPAAPVAVAVAPTA